MDKKSKILRQLLKEQPSSLTIQVGTAHQAQLAQRLGFSIVGVSGSNTSTQILGLPDAGLITMTEMVENIERICPAINLPVVADCDTGFGNAINVRRTVDLVMRAGAAALFIEDQVAPKRCGFVKGKELISLEEAVGKYRAALDVRDELDPDFIVIARTDARGAVGGGMDEVFRRGEAYLKAGVDVLYVEALQSREEIYQVRQHFPDCLLKATTQAINPPLTQKETEELHLCMPSIHITQVGSIALYDFLARLKERGIDEFNDFREKHKGHPRGGFGIFDVAGFPAIVEWEKKYLPSENIEKYESSLGVYDPRVGHGKKP